ncbi:uncharacterized protein LOC135808847 isoform X1 [Sycon ciliatum]|uniref:uncharacterized protein LOC135808847 isoform X1 n=1 Tax=Sycon ciliatum TaxID=27933 RepID=UPI0031F66346
MDDTAGWLCEEPGSGSFHDLRDEVAPPLVDDTMIYSPVGSLASRAGSPKGKRRRSLRQLSRVSIAAAAVQESLLSGDTSRRYSPRLASRCSIPMDCVDANSEISSGATPVPSRTQASTSRNVPCSVSRPPPSVCRASSRAAATPQLTVRSRLPMSEAKARGITFSLFKTPPKSAVGQTCRPVGPDEDTEDKVLRRLSFSKLFAVDTSGEALNDSNSVTSQPEEDRSCMASSSIAFPSAAAAVKKNAITPAKKTKLSRATSLSAPSNRHWQESRSASKTPSTIQRPGAVSKLKKTKENEASSTRSPSKLSLSWKSTTSSRPAATPKKPLGDSNRMCHTSTKASPPKRSHLVRSASKAQRPSQNSNMAEKIEKKTQSRIDKVLGTSTSSHRSGGLGRSLSFRRPTSLRPLPGSSQTSAVKSPKLKSTHGSTQMTDAVSPGAKKRKLKAASRASIFCAELR